MSLLGHLLPPLRNIRTSAESAEQLLRNELARLSSSLSAPTAEQKELLCWLDHIRHVLETIGGMAGGLLDAAEFDSPYSWQHVVSFHADDMLYAVRYLKTVCDALEQHRRQIEEAVRRLPLDELSRLLQQALYAAPYALDGLQEAQQTFARAAEDARPQDVPPVSELQVSAVTSRVTAPGGYGAVDLMFWEKDFRYMAEGVLREYENLREVFGGMYSVDHGTQIRVSLSSEDVAIQDPEETLVWRGRFLRFGFGFRVPEDYPRKQILLTARVCFNEIPATRLRLLVDCSARPGQAASVQRQDIRSVFMSYASPDRMRVVDVIQGMQQVRPDLDIFLDVDTLRSGDKWQARLMHEIDVRDLLYLCWSRAAKASPFVALEWQHALNTKGADAIMPIPLEPAECCPPPPELSHLHFNNRLLYLLRLKY